MASYPNITPPPLTHFPPAPREKKSTIDLKKIGTLLTESLDEGNTITGIVFDSLEDQAAMTYFDSNELPFSDPVTTTSGFLDFIGPLNTTIEILQSRPPYRKVENRARLALNVVSGSADFFFTFTKMLINVGIPVLMSFMNTMSNPVSLFIATSELINASIDLYHAHKELDFQHWLDEKIQEVQHLNKKLIQIKSRLTHEMNTVAKDEKTNPLFEKRSLQLIQERTKWITRRESLLTDIESRSRVYYAHLSDSQKSEAKELLETKLAKLRPASHAATGTIPFHIAPTESEIRRNNAIQQHLNRRLKECKTRFYTRTLCFVGMSLLLAATFTACPPLALTGMLIGILASFYCLYTNGQKLRNAANHLFFKGIPPSKHVKTFKRAVVSPKIRSHRLHSTFIHNIR